MNACVNTYEMRMPAHYVDMNKKEMEYDGGLWWIVVCDLVSLACSAINIGIDLAKGAGLIGDELNDVQNALSVVGAVTGYIGGIGGLATTTETVVTRKVASSIYSTTIGPADTVIRYNY